MTDDAERRLAEVAEGMAQTLFPTVKRLIAGLTDEEAMAAARRIIALRLSYETGILLTPRNPPGDHDTGPRRRE